MDIPAAHSIRFLQHCSPQIKTTIIWRIKATFFSHRFIRVDPPNPRPFFFLNCTKNTELTRGHFKRTVTFALHKKIHLVLAGKPVWIAFNHQSSKTATSRHWQMKLEEWKTYRTRFLVKAKQLSSNLTFVDHLGRQHCGRKGDYLVESFDGVLSIAPRRIFEDIYVLMSAPDSLANEAAMTEPKLDRLPFEPLEIEEVHLEKATMPRKRVEACMVGRDEPIRDRRKLPQPCRDRRASAQHVRLM